MDLKLPSITVFAASFIGGLALAWAPSTGGTTLESVPTPSAGGEIAADACVARHARDLQAAQLALAAVHERLRAMRAEEVALIGEPIPFPDDLPQGYTPESAERALVAALDGTPFRVAAMDCDEYPCLAILRWPVGGADGADPYGALERKGLGASMPAIGTHADESGRSWSQATVLLHPSAPTSPYLDRRRAFRAGILHQQLAAERDLGAPSERDRGAP